MTEWRVKFQLNNERLLGTLGLARRAGKITGGFDAAVGDIRQGKTRLVLVASDISEKTFKNVKFEADRKNIQTLRVEPSKDSLGHACGIRAGIISIGDEGFAKAVEKLIANDIEDKQTGKADIKEE